MIIISCTSVILCNLFWIGNSVRVACKRSSHYHKLHDKWRWPRDAKSISFLMIGKSWFPDRNEYGKDLYPPVDSRSPLISCPRGAYQELFTRCKRYLLPCSVLSSQHGGMWHKPYPMSFIIISEGVINNMLGKEHQHSTYTLYSAAFRMLCLQNVLI